MIEKRKLQQLNGRETTRNKTSAISKARVTAMKRKVQSVI